MQHLATSSVSPVPFFAVVIVLVLFPNEKKRVVLRLVPLDIVPLKENGLCSCTVAVVNQVHE